jgi:hypothetical protein
MTESFQNPWLVIHFAHNVPECGRSSHATEKEAIAAARELFMEYYNPNECIYVYELRRIVRLEAKEQCQ